MGSLERDHGEGRGTAEEGCYYSQVISTGGSIDTDCAERWAGELVLTEDWIPHMPVTPEDSEVFASQFTLDNTRSEDFKRESKSPQVVADGEQGWRGPGH